MTMWFLMFNFTTIFKRTRGNIAINLRMHPAALPTLVTQQSHCSFKWICRVLSDSDNRNDGTYRLNISFFLQRAKCWVFVRSVFHSIKMIRNMLLDVPIALEWSALPHGAKRHRPVPIVGEKKSGSRSVYIIFFSQPLTPIYLQGRDIRWRKKEVEIVGTGEEYRISFWWPVCEKRAFTAV